MQMSGSNKLSNPIMIRLETRLITLDVVTYLSEMKMDGKLHKCVIAKFGHNITRPHRPWRVYYMQFQIRQYYEMYCALHL